ncbi:MAG TPA: hypothetical protein VGO93_03290, partial [Candidatus Xenobia bacterium]
IFLDKPGYKPYDRKLTVGSGQMTVLDAEVDQLEAATAPAPPPRVWTTPLPPPRPWVPPTPVPGPKATAL